MKTNGTDFIESASLTSWRTWIDVQGYAHKCPIANPTKRSELSRINATGEPIMPADSLLFDFPSDIRNSSIALRSEHHNSSWVAPRPFFAVSDVSGFQWLVRAVLTFRLQDV